MKRMSALVILGGIFLLGQEKTRITLDVTRVILLVTVTDRRGHFVTDLTRNDFEILEEKRPQKILEFFPESDVPLQMAVLVDASNSVRDRFRFIQEAAIAFLRTTIRPGRDEAMVVSFDSSVEVVAKGTDDIEKLASPIRELRPGRGTALYDAIHFATREMSRREDSANRFRHAIVVISDGEDTDSRVSRDMALESAQKADAVIYAVSTNTSQLEVHGDKVLNYLASETGGRALLPRGADPRPSFAKIGDELRHQYSILYRPEPLKSDGKFHPVTVRVPTKKGVVVRARKGYYARP